MTSADVWLKNQTTVPTVTVRRRHQRPGERDVQRDELPRLIDDGPEQRAQPLRRADGTHERAINSNARIDEATGNYVYSGLAIQRGGMRDAGFFVQDSWRVKPNLTLNLGLRYELQFPFASHNNSYSTATVDDAWGRSGNVAGCNPSNPTPATCNLFKAGTLPGQLPQFTQLGEGTGAYSTDLDNWAPSVGFNWTPNAKDGCARFDHGAAWRVRYPWRLPARVSAQRPDRLHGRLQRESGHRHYDQSQPGAGNLVPAGGSFPVLFRDPANLNPPSFPEKPVYPMTDVVTQDVNVFDPNFQVPYADTYTIGVQRGLTRTMAFEIRYVGTRSREQVATYNLNEINIIENGFLNEFKVAQANLLAHVSAGCGTTGQPACSFAYRGAGTGTSPLPIYLAYLNGSADRNNAAAYAGGNWTNATFINPLARNNPNPFNAANSLDDDAGTSDGRAGGRTAGESARRQPGLPGRGQHHRQRRATRGSTACSSSCGVASRVVSSSRRATRTGSRRTRRATRSACPARKSGSRVAKAK